MENKKVIKIRNCRGCGNKKAKDELLRIAVSKNGEPAFDLKQRLDGRGFYACYDKSCMTKLFKLKEFRKAGFSICSEFCNIVVEMLNKELTGLISIGKKSGKFISGYEKVVASTRSGRVSLIITAGDVSEGRRKKFLKTVNNMAEVITFGDKEKIGIAVGKGLTSYGAFIDMGLTEKFMLVHKKLVSLSRSF